MHTIRHLLLLLFASLAFFHGAQAANILAAHPLAVGMAERLLENTDNTILLAAPKNLPATRQLNYLENRGQEALARLSAEADIVLTVRSIYAQDYLYPLARRHNIRLIPVDIARPLDGLSTGVALLDIPVAQHQVWLDPESLGAIASLLAREISTFAPEQQAQIAANAEREHKRLRNLKNDMEIFLGDSAKAPVFLLLNPELAYFAQGLQAPAIASELPTPDNHKALARLIAENSINLALYHSELDEAQNAFLAEQGVTLIIIPRLQAEDPVAQLEQHYRRIQSALSPP